MNKQREPLISLISYRISTWFGVTPMFRLYFRGHLYGRGDVPQSGPLVIASNHASYFDPPILACAMRRPVAYMAKEELFEVPFLKQLIQIYGAFPVKRTSADRSAIRAGLQALSEGWAMGIFLQGSRTPDGRISAPKLGAATIAAKAQVPILPVSIWGTDKISDGSNFPRPVPVTIRVGDLLPPPSKTKKEELQAVSRKCADVINEMHALGR